MNRSTVGPRSYIVPKDVHLPSTEGMPELAWAIETATTPVAIDHANRANMAEYAARSSEWWNLGKEMAQQRAGNPSRSQGAESQAATSPGGSQAEAPSEENSEAKGGCRSRALGSASLEEESAASQQEGEES